MINSRYQLDKIIITAMDRFVWFLLLVVFSHLVTEFTRVTGYARGPRHDAVMVNDSLIRPIKVQNLVQYPGQEFGQYAQQSPSYYSGNNQYNNYDNNVNTPPNNNNNNNNFISNMFNGLFNPSSNNAGNAGISNTNNNNNNNNDFTNYAPAYPQSNANLESIGQAIIRPMGMVRPIIDSIFEIPISTLRAVNNLVGRLTGSYQIQLPYQQQQQNTNYQPRPTSQAAAGSPQQQFFPSFPSLPSFPFFSGAPTTQQSNYNNGLQKSASSSASSPPKTEIEMLKRIRQVASNNRGGSNSNTQQQ
ncbi:uncharacterized protein LOC142240837 isoform X2 [Haematobia irritans]|uniref:uncharacterized protein LOC142240837 isoform X2 n=1 Tax=Haematobia irritans TaxID=7368 RepID=UPI003F506A91